ncbi:MAG: YdiY family protein [Parahaliea sp.]
MAVAAETGSALTDEIVLVNGSRVLGTITATRDGVVTMETEFAGVLSIAQDKIQSMHTGRPVVMKLGDGTVVENQPIVTQDSELVLPASLTTGSSYSLADLAVMNPEPWELGQGYRWTGLVSAALTMQDGNTDSKEFDYRLESVWRSLRDRFTITGTGEMDEANSQKNAENWKLIGKYDYFLDGPWYTGINAGVEADKFADLDLRYYIGPYIGRQIFEAPELTLAVEGGAVYVNEDYIVADDEEYPGLNWTVNASSNVLGGESRLYLSHNGILNLDDAGDLIMNTTLGLAFPLMYNIEAAAELVLQYDSGVPDDVEEVDQTYRFRIGYVW